MFCSRSRTSYFFLRSSNMLEFLIKPLFFNPLYFYFPREGPSCSFWPPLNLKRTLYEHFLTFRIQDPICWAWGELLFEKQLCCANTSVFKWPIKNFNLSRHTETSERWWCLKSVLFYRFTASTSFSAADQYLNVKYLQFNTETCKAKKDALMFHCKTIHVLYEWTGYLQSGASLCAQSVEAGPQLCLPLFDHKVRSQLPLSRPLLLRHAWLNCGSWKLKDI